MKSRFASASGQGTIRGSSIAVPAGTVTVSGHSWDIGWLGVLTGPLPVFRPLPLVGKYLVNLVALFYVRVQSFQESTDAVSAEKSGADCSAQSA